MKCLIIAAGQGTRLRAKGEVKPLIPLLGVPLIERVIRSAIEGGADEFYVVTGHQGEQVANFLKQLAKRLNVAVTLIQNDDWQKENGFSVLKAGLAFINNIPVFIASDPERRWARHFKEAGLPIIGDVPMNLELRLSVEDSPNSAGVVIDAIRCAKLALDRKQGGVLTGPSAYFCKHPPKQFTDDEAYKMTEAFIEGKRED